MSSLAQEESRSISENTAWGKRKLFAEGKCSVGYGAFLGYDKDFKVNQEQAETVRLIYELFLSGMSSHTVAKELEKRGLLSPTGKKDGMPRQYSLYLPMKNIVGTQGYRSRLLWISSRENVRIMRESCHSTM